MSCVDQLQNMRVVKSITDIVGIGSRVIVTSWRQMNISGMERLVSSGDTGIVTLIDGDIAVIRSVNSDFRFLISDIATTPDIVQVVKKRIADMETWRGKFRDYKHVEISG